jgi:putative flippase GtrA
MFWLKKIHEYVLSSTFIKFCLIGIINAIVGFSIILSLIYIFNVNYMVSNFIGYGAGIMTSFVLNKFLNFKSDGKIKVELPIFAGSFVIAYLINATVLYTFVEILHESKIVGLVVSSASYTVVFYLASRFLVFTRSHPAKSP